MVEFGLSDFEVRTVGSAPMIGVFIALTLLTFESNKYGKKNNHLKE
ncbi:hypothetical protein [Flavivirga aquatica]|nr:hypothetical protein [Flavivirga aquatica]